MLIAATGTDGRPLTVLTDAAPDLRDVRQAVDAVLTGFLAAKRRSAAAALRKLSDTLCGFLFAGGNRIRPVMGLCGWYAAGGRGDPEPVVRAAVSLELFHTFGLVHDGVMDDSDLRRGRSGGTRPSCSATSPRPCPTNCCTRVARPTNCGRRSR